MTVAAKRSKSKLLATHGSVKVYPGRKRGSYRLRWTGLAGQRRERVFKGTLAEAKQVAKRLDTELTEEKGLQRARRNATPRPGSAKLSGVSTVRDLLAAYRQSPIGGNWSAGTRKTVEACHRNQIAGYLGEIRLRDLTPEDVSWWWSELVTKRASNEIGCDDTLLKARMQFNAAIKYARSSAAITSTTSATLTDKSLTPFRRGGGTKTNQLFIDKSKDLPARESLVAVAKRVGEEDERFGLLLEVMLHSGLRFSEALALGTGPYCNQVTDQVVSVDWQQDQHNTKSHGRVVLPKGNKTRSTIISDAEVALRLQALPVDKEGFYFRRDNGSLVTPKWFSKYIWHPAFDSLDLHWPTTRTTHCFRHEFAFHLLAQGVLVADVSAALGHSSVAFTLDRYVNSGEDAMKRVLSSLAR